MTLIKKPLIETFQKPAFIPDEFVKPASYNGDGFGYADLAVLAEANSVMIHIALLEHLEQLETIDLICEGFIGSVAHIDNQYAEKAFKLYDRFCLLGDIFDDEIKHYQEWRYTILAESIVTACIGAVTRFAQDPSSIGYVQHPGQLSVGEIVDKHYELMKQVCIQYS
jgi:hypothetical protein